jgi:hypothetical protein
MPVIIITIEFNNDDKKLLKESVPHKPLGVKELMKKKNHSVIPVTLKQTKVSSV